MSSSQRVLLGICCLVAATVISASKHATSGGCPFWDTPAKSPCHALTNCTKDSECLTKWKCCDDRCGKVCKQQIDIPSKCPTKSTPEGSPCHAHTTCTKDADCLTGWACCPDRCGKVCKQATKKKA